MGEKERRVDLEDPRETKLENGMKEVTTRNIRGGNVRITDGVLYSHTLYAAMKGPCVMNAYVHSCLLYTSRCV